MTETFYDAESGLKIDVHFEPVFDSIPAVLAAHKPKLDKAFELIRKMESGEIVNHTDVKAESEDRQVDHYNLRLEEEKVPGKSLAKTL